MFGISFSEILLICLITLLVFGPKQLATIAKALATIIRTTQHYFHSLKSDLYAKSGLAEIKQVQHGVFDTYLNIKNNITQPGDNLNQVRPPFGNNSVIQDTACVIRDPRLALQTESFTQPELNFEQQPELF